MVSVCTNPLPGIADVQNGVAPLRRTTWANAGTHSNPHNLRQVAGSRAIKAGSPQVLVPNTITPFSRSATILVSVSNNTNFFTYFINFSSYDAFDYSA